MAERWQTPPEPTDENLVAKVAAGDLGAFSLLYDRYARPVYVMAVHLLGAAEADDVVQETFLRLWRSADQFDEQRGRFAPWFLAIARHDVSARLRRRTREQRLFLAETIDQILTAAPDPAVDVAEQVWRQEEGDRVRLALAALPEEQRRVLVLAYFGDLSQVTIATSLGWPLGTVKKRVRLGLQKLRQALGADSSGDKGDAIPDGKSVPVQHGNRMRVTDGP